VRLIEDRGQPRHPGSLRRTAERKDETDTPSRPHTSPPLITLAAYYRPSILA
jgi:hypothetical protein